MPGEEAWIGTEMATRMGPVKDRRIIGLWSGSQADFEIVLRHLKEEVGYSCHNRGKAWLVFDRVTGGDSIIDFFHLTATTLFEMLVKHC